MSNIFKGVDVLAPDAKQTLVARMNEVDSRLTPQFHAFLNSLTPEQKEAFLPLWQMNQDVMKWQGALHAVRAFQHAQMLDEHAQAREAKAARADARKDETIQALQAQVKTLKEQVQRLERKRNPAPRTVPTALVSGQDWDYRPAETYTPKRGEVVTSSPTPVEDVARVIEAFVMRVGACSKSDVSAAHPQHRAHLSAAYRHLHAAKRIHVNGWTLSPWSERLHGPR